jgi:replicative DNA helicase
MSGNGSELLRIAQDADAEREIFGYILRQPEALNAVAEQLQPGDFYHSPHPEIFRAMLKVQAEGREVEVWSVFEALSGNSEIQRLGGKDFLSSLTRGLAPGSSVKSVCRIVKEHADRRRLQKAIHSAAEQVEDAKPSNSEVLQDLYDELDAIRENSIANRGVTHIADVCRTLAPTMGRLSEGRGLMLGVSTGSWGLDQIMPGLVPGEFLVLGARPSVGKSAFGVEFALNLAKDGHPVVLFSLEMSAEATLLRVICREGHVDYHRLVSGKLSREGWIEAIAAIGRVTRLPIYIDDRSRVSARDLRWRLLSLAQQKKIRLAIVDYIQLLTAKGQNRFEQVTAISQELKAAAKDLGKISEGTLLALSQLNRLAATEEPGLHHLRESGQIEQDTDVVMFLFNDRTDPNLKQLKIAKQRNGPLDTVRLRFIPPCMEFKEI